MSVKKKKPLPIHPGEILLQEFLKPMEISQARLAKALSVPSRRIHNIVRGQHAVSAEIALRLACYFGNSALFWLNLQTHYDLEIESDRIGDRLKREIHQRKA